MNEFESDAIRVVTRSAAETSGVGGLVATHVRPGDLIALHGELGAGKTQFVRGLAAGLGADPARVASPTFVLIHEYETSSRGPVLVHIDAYRLHSGHDLESIGWELNPKGDAPAGGELRNGAVVVVEWASRLGDAIGGDSLDIQLAHVGSGKPDAREITLSPRGDWWARWPALRDALYRFGAADRKEVGRE